MSAEAGCFFLGHKASCLASFRPVDARSRLEAYAAITVRGRFDCLIGRLFGASSPEQIKRLWPISTPEWLTTQRGPSTNHR